MKDEEFGGLPPLSKVSDLIRLLPLLAKLQAVVAAKAPHEKALALVAALRTLADQTDTQADNAALNHAEKILSSPEGAAFVDWLVSTYGGA